LQVNAIHECLTLVAALLVVSAAAAQERVEVREYSPSDECDWQLTRRLAGLAGLPAGHAHWPSLWPDDDPRTERAGVELLAEVDGLVVGRVLLEAHHHPYCELVNLCVRPDCEGMGVATALVQESIRRARQLGFKVMVLQESLDDGPAHGIYQRAGFVPATRGDMQRMVKLLDVPLVASLLRTFPDAEFVSEPPPDRGEKWWRLSWHAGADDFVALYLHGGSCQFDSDGFQPVIQACEFAYNGVSLAVEADMAAEIARGAVGDLRLHLENRGAEPFEGAVRAMLLPETEIDGEAALGALAVKLEPGGEQTAVLPIRARHQFRCDYLPFGSYLSVPMTAEVCWKAGSVLLSVAVKVRAFSDGECLG
jgi:ribosomal protein S18 acetylase RimI-like enzyme